MLAADDVGGADKPPRPTPVGAAAAVVVVIVDDVGKEIVVALDIVVGIKKGVEVTG